MIWFAGLGLGLGFLLAGGGVPAEGTSLTYVPPSREPVALTVAGSSIGSGLAVAADGSLQLKWREGAGAREDEAIQARTWQFGLPPGPPVEDRWEPPEGPFRLMVWEQAGVRYTQTFLVTCLDPVESLPGSPVDSPRVGLVHLKGENTNSEYADASSGLVCLGGAVSSELKLDLGIVYRREGEGWVAVGAIDVPTEGIAQPHGPALKFYGHMPPGLSGGMTFKLLLAPIAAEADLEKLRNLDFDQEYRRVRRAWQSHGGGP